MNKQIYESIAAFHPGYYIADIIEDMGINQKEFAIRLGVSEKLISDLVSGQINMSNSTALKLSNMLGTSVSVWLNLQKAYDEKVLEIEQQVFMDKQKDYVDNIIDYSYFVKLGVVNATKDAAEKVRNLWTYFKIADFNAFKNADLLVNYRCGISEVKEKNIINAQAWLQTAINIASEFKTPDFDEKKLKGFLPEIRNMTIQSPSTFLPRLKEIFCECGVRFILLPYLKNSGINGAVKWLDSKTVVLAMNDRRCYADTFWFTLFHEIKHILQHKIKTTFISSSDKDWPIIENEHEGEADKFSQDYLIPPNEYQKFLERAGVLSDYVIREFAKTIGIHPGVVVGRLQHDNKLPANRCSNMRERYRIVRPSET